MKSKTIIISNSNSSGRGILTLYLEDELLKAKLRLYDFPMLNADCKLGIYHNEEVYSSNLILKNGVYTTSLVGNFDLNSDFYTAIIDTNLNNQVLLSGGTYAGFYFNDSTVFSANNLSTINQPYTEQEDASNTQSKIENISNETCQNDCAHCKYKEFFYANQPTKIANEKEDIFPIPDLPQPKKEEKLAPTVLDSLLPQFDYIINHYPENNELNNLLNDSKFVQISEGENNYSIGAIYESENMKYICYAIKCNYNTPAPEELGKFYQWLPIDAEDPLSEGYYIVYQDAKDLKIIEI